MMIIYSTPTIQRKYKCMYKKVSLFSGLLMVFVLFVPVVTAQGIPSTSIKQQTDPQIRQNRMGTIVIQTRPGAVVKVNQERHEFLFGAALSNGIFSDRADPVTKEQYLAIFKENFNAAVTENAFKWPGIERERGMFDYSLPDRMYAFCSANGIHLRGHNIYWGIERFIQDWIKELDNETLYDVLRSRGREVTARYRDKVIEFDLNNEMIHGNYYEERLGETITADMVRWAKEGNPEALLYFNDYDILTGNVLDRYVAHIRNNLDSGIPFDGIGVQGHLHADSFDPEVLKTSLDVLSQFNLPIKVTEFNFPGQRFQINRQTPLTPEQEEAKAAAIVDYYRICFAHPSVDSILMWGFWEGANWIPQSSLYRRDWTPTPAAEAYQELIYGEWWTEWEGSADADGRCELPAFYGRHSVEAGGETKTVELLKREGTITVQIGH